MKVIVGVTDNEASMVQGAGLKAITSHWAKGEKVHALM
jgi:hypothetical protein